MQIKEDYINLAKFILIILIVIALGVFIVNQVMSYRYKVVFIKTPCDLCAQLNKNQSKCIDGCFNKQLILFPNGWNEWTDGNGTCYDSAGNKLLNCKTKNETLNKGLVIDLNSIPS